jgi:hypothetical protein
LAELAALAAVTLWLSSCASNGGGGTITMPSGICAENPACCDSSGNFDAMTCSTTAGSLAAGAISQGKDAGLTTELANSEGLAGNQTYAKTADPNAAAATASLGNTAPTGGVASAALSAATNPNTGGTSLGSGSAGGGGSAGAGGSGSFAGGGTTTAPASVGDTAAAGNALSAQALDEGAGAAVAMGSSRGTRGNAMGESGEGMFGGLFDAMNGKNGAGRAPAGEMKFRGEIDPLTGKPTSGSADPADYFSRLTANDSLFKVVERRYQQQAMTWARQQ